MAECVVQLWYNKNRPKKSGKVSLYIQLLVNGEHDEIPIKNLEWPVDKISWKEKKLVERFAEDPDWLTYISAIERERAKYWAVIRRFIQNDLPFKLADVHREVNRYARGHLFCQFMSDSIRERRKSKIPKVRIKDSTGEVQQVSQRALLEYTKGLDVEISKIDADWLEAYANHLRDMMSENTVWVRIKDVKTYLSYAFKKKLLVNLDYKNFSVTPEETEPTWLEENEIKSLLQLYFRCELLSSDKRNLRAFLFGCFTGLRVSDLTRWNKDWIQGDEIVFVPAKARWSKRPPKPIRIPIIPIARQFIEDLKSETLDIPSDQAYNREIKRFSEMAGFDKNLTTHVSRHTFATWLAMMDIPVLVISKLLGHKSTRQTMVYIHIAEHYKAVQMMKLQQKFGNYGFDKSASTQNIRSANRLNAFAGKNQ
jgi:integrase/recombinase XerD